MHRFTFVLAAMLATALIAAGCGDDDETTTTTTAETATGETGATGAQGASSDWAQQADQICSEGDKEIDSEAQDLFGNGQQEPSPAEQEKFAEDVLIPNVEKQIDEISGLTPPEGQEDQVDEFLDSARSDLDDVKADPSVITGQGGEDPFAETRQLAQDLGLKACAQ